MRILFVVSYILLLLLTSHLCHAQEGRLLTVDKELSSSMINDVYQDKEDIIWIATEDGLNCYDGAKFTTYKHIPDNPHSLKNNYTRILFEDFDGYFYIGTLNGIQTYDRATKRFTDLPLILGNGSPIEANVSSIIKSRNGNILVGTSGHGVFSLTEEEGNRKLQQIPDILPSFLIEQLYEDNRGFLWAITTDKGIYCVDTNKHIKNYTEEIAWPSCICEDASGNVYIGSMKNGLFRYDPQSDGFTQIVYPPLPNLPVKTLVPINKNEIYIGTDGNGMKIYNTFTQTIQEGDINVNSFNFDKAKVHSILKDRQGNTWLGLFQKGVMIIPAVTNGFEYIGYKSSTHNVIGSSCIMSLYKSHDGTLWVGTDNDGLYGIAPDKTLKKHFTQGKDVAHTVSSTIMSIHEDTDGNLWIGSYRDGLAKINPQNGYCEYIPLPASESENAQSIYSITEDQHKRLWIGVMGSGLYSMDIRSGKISNMPTPRSGLEYRSQSNTLHNRWINCLLCTHNEKLYIGTYDGLGCLDIPTMNFVSTYNINRLLPGEAIYSLYEDEENDIWIGTSQGLKCLSPTTGEIVCYTMEDGLPNNSISAIKGDTNGNLWISTNFGLSRFNKQTQTFVNFYAGDGLQGNEFSKGAAFVETGREIIFGGTGGITCFNPQRIFSFDKKPEIRIADFYIHGKQVCLGMKSGGKDIVNTAVQNARKFHLSYKDNSFSIEFSAMEFYSPERITYSYAFNNNNWVNLQPGLNRVSFSDLAPGTYRFRVKAKDYNSYSEVKELTIIISPPWYASWWAKSGYFLIACIIIGLILQQIRQRYRARQKMLEHIHAEQMNEAKLQFFINISHEIRTPMSLIISPLQQLMSTDTDRERRHTYATIYRNAERILDLVNQLMDIRKIDKGQMRLKFREMDMVGFIRDLCNTFEYQAKTKHIELKFEPQMEELKVWIDPKNFDKVILNLLSNAFKFTPENGHIQISLNTGTDTGAILKELCNYVEIIITDDGIGIDAKEIERIFDRFFQIRNSQNNLHTGTGIGLHLSRSLVKLHHGTIQAENNVNAPGCHFTIRLPLGKAHLKDEEIEQSDIKAPMPVHTVTPLPDQLINEEEEEKMRAKTRRRIMVVEDDEEIRQYICHELSRDFYIQEYANGKEALATILQKAPDLIISDIMMPEMDGLTLCQKVKQNITINHIPIILLTAKSREEDNLEGLNMGADAYIVKPFSIEILRKTAINLIKSRDMLKNTYSGNQEQEERVQKLEAESPDERLLNRVMKVINDNIGNVNLNVEMIAAEVGISRVHLHRKLKELTNQSTRDLIRNVRLKQAASLLAGKHHSITEVASLTGFANTAYFSTAFKDLYGISPTAYMEQNLGSNSESEKTTGAGPK